MSATDYALTSMARLQIVGGVNSTLLSIRVDFATSAFVELVCVVDVVLV
jgi:hypothetical protein